MWRQSRLLWVADESPDRSLGGGSIRQAHLFEAVASSYATDLLLVGRVADERVRSLATNVVELPDVRGGWTEHPVGRRLLELAIMVGSPCPSYAFPARPARRALNRAIRDLPGSYDLVCVEHAALSPLRLTNGAKSLITFHHLFSGMARQELEIAPGFRQRLYRSVDLRKAERLERRAQRTFDAVIVCSPEDRAALGGNGSIDRSRISVIPNGVDLAKFRPGPLPTSPRILFPATLGYAPNVDGALWFCSEVWPRIRAQVPAATLDLVGRTPVDEIVRLGALEGVSVSADVPSVNPYYEAARAVVVPLRSGTGTRLKALEAMAARRPVVGTAIGLEGLGVTSGQQVLIADDASRFADAVVEVLRNGGLAARLAAAGRSHVEERFGWDRIGRDYVQLIGRLIGETADEPRVTQRESDT
jgi:glycosyltransferase involved in cell wall biosynthesis